MLGKFGEVPIIKLPLCNPQCQLPLHSPLYDTSIRLSYSIVLLEKSMASIEYLLLANHVEVQNGLLYISGGGWANLFRGPLAPDEPPPINHFGVAVSLAIPWEETNQAHRIDIRVVHETDQEDTQPVAHIGGGIEVGRPAGIEAGTVQRVAVGFSIDTAFPKEGRYHVVAQIGEDTRSVDFMVFNEPKPPFIR
jgi:hypothetical protein